MKAEKKYHIDWQDLGLARDPFLTQSERAFFEPASWVPLLEMLEHMAQYSNTLILIKGARDSGKTTFMEYANAHLARHMSTYQLDADAELTPEELVQTITTAFSLPDPDPRIEVVEQVRTQIDALAHWDNSYLLMIDDAHKLPRVTLEFLLKIIQIQAHSLPKLHIMLFAETAIEQWLSQFDWHELENAVHEVALPSLDVDTVRQYLLHRFRAAGLEGELPLTAEKIQHITQLAEGLPGKIAAATRSQLVTKPPFARTPVMHWVFNRYAISGLSVLVIALTFFLSQPPKNARTIEVVAQPHHLEMPPAPVITVAVAEPLPEALSEALPEPLPTPLPAPLPEKPIKRPPSLSYGIQLMGTRDQAMAEKFITTNKIVEQSHIVKSDLAGKPWYLVLYGNYEDQDHAKLAVQTLPTELKSLKPWVRKYANIPV